MDFFTKKLPRALRLLVFSIAAVMITACSTPQAQQNAFITLQFTQRAGEDQELEENTSAKKLVVALKGDYEEVQTVEFIDEALVTFEKVLVGARIYVQADLYIQEQLLYTGSSDLFTVTAGENEVLIELKKLYTVSFDTNGGSGTIQSQRVAEGKTAAQPELTPSKEKDENFAYTFAGWFTSQDNGATLAQTPYDFASPVTGDLTLYAKWNAKPFFTVTFNANGGSNPPKSQRVLSGEKALSPAESELPVKAGDSAHEYAFKGWYTSTDGGTTLSETPYDFETAVTGDITLYAKWAALVQTDIVDVEIPVDQIESITVTGPTDNNDGTYTFTAEAGYDSYIWKFDGFDKNPTTNVSYSTTNTFTTPNMSSGYYGAPGTYSVTLLATKTVNGVTKYYSYTTQIIKD